MASDVFQIAADLHVHSTASDGELAPEQVVEAAAQAGLKTVALTDHDTLAGVAAAQARGKELGIEVVPGCELTAYEGRIELHILAYFVDPGLQAPLAKLLARVRERRRERAFEMGAKLRALGMPIDDADILAAAGDAESVGQPHVAKAMVARGHVSSVRAGIIKYLRAGAPAHVAKLQLSPEDVFEAVRASGGVTVLAHPGVGGHDELIAPLFRRGLDGVEAHHQSHSAVNRRFYQRLAERYEKAVGGGSDFHGSGVKPGVMVGSSGVSGGMLKDLRARAAERASRCAPASV
ncbi:MAG: PHP domain-containing protein [Planctomycetes bacterium]|nr:PHP domain-containing protein [Planctomycetota bacterium]